MRKNVLALSITAAIVGLGFAGGAQAIVTVGQGNVNRLMLSDNGVGHIAIVPYYTTQGTNHTMINIVNTDTVNGKAVKVRFRAAGNSDDVFDFQLFLSPADVWAGDVYTDAATGLPRVDTKDNSCTKPNLKDPLKNKGFITTRLNPSLATAAKNATALEGYVEILNMADIPLNPTRWTLYDEIVHNRSGVALCDGPAWAALDTNLADLAAANNVGLTNPSTGLAANWTIINITKAAAWAGSATALEALNSSGVGLGNLVYWPQTDDLVGLNTANYTADPLLAKYAASGTPVIKAQMFDLPDLSTPYTGTVTSAPADALRQATDLTSSLATTSIANEYLTTDATVTAATDWVFAMPTRRYSVASSYSGSDPRVFSVLNTNYFTVANTQNIGGLICVDGIQYKAYNREEALVGNVVVSPASPPVFCGEVNVISFNNAAATTTAVLGAKIAVKDLDVTYANGWMSILTPGLANVGLPIIGQAFSHASFTSGAATSWFGGNVEHRYRHVNVTVWPGTY